MELLVTSSIVNKLNQPPSIEQKVVPNYVKKEISMQTIIIEVF